VNKNFNSNRNLQHAGSLASSKGKDNSKDHSYVNEAKKRSSRNIKHLPIFANLVQETVNNLTITTPKSEKPIEPELRFVHGISYKKNKPKTALKIMDNPNQAEEQQLIKNYKQKIQLNNQLNKSTKFKKRNNKSKNILKSNREEKSKKYI